MLEFQVLIFKDLESSINFLGTVLMGSTASTYTVRGTCTCTYRCACMWLPEDSYVVDYMYLTDNFFLKLKLPEQVWDGQHTKTKEVHSKKQVNVFLAEQLKW